MIKISAVVNTRNEEKNIEYCLETLRWCDEIVVVDMESTDKTVEIAQQFTNRIFTYPLVANFDIAKKFAVEKSTGDWILLLDADEMISPSLATTLQQLASKDNIDIVEIPFMHYIMGACIEYTGWGYTPLPRFFRRDAICFSGIIHDYMHCADGTSIFRLASIQKNCITHFNYRDAAHFVEKLNRYTSTEALNLFKHGFHFSYHRLMLESLREFYRRYIAGRGYREGVRGFSLSLMMAFYRMLSHIKLWELYEYGQLSVEARYDALRQELMDEWQANEKFQANT